MNSFSERMLVWRPNVWQQQFSASWPDLPYASNTPSHQVQPRGFCSAGGVGLTLVLDKTTSKRNLCDVKDAVPSVAYTETEPAHPDLFEMPLHRSHDNYAPL